jgi:diamine N-acetyltransferase
MLSQDTEKAQYYLWRFMIDARYQGLGFGTRALEQVIAYVRALPGAKEMTLTFVPGELSPAAFYRRLGFVETGVEHDGELEMKLIFEETGGSS